MILDKRTVIDIVVSVLMCIVIFFEIKTGMGLLTNKWESDANKLVQAAKSAGQDIGIIDTAFHWPEVEYPREDGDVVKIDGNKYQINGELTGVDTDYNGTIYYADIETKASKQLNYGEVVDLNMVTHFREALTRYFEGDAELLLQIAEPETSLDDWECYQQEFMGGVIPIMYNTVDSVYVMVLDCNTSFYLLKCSDPFVVTDGRVTVHYSDPTKDPLKEHTWNHYELGAIDNTRWQLSMGITYDEDGNPSRTDTGSLDPDSSDDSVDSLYNKPADQTARQTLVSYADKEFNEDGKALDGSCALDLTSTAAKASEWVLTETSYTFTDNGLTINGLSGKRNATEFEISGNVSNMMSSERPWVLVVKFMGDSSNLLGVRVLDNRSDPIGADGVASFTVSLNVDSGIDFSQITAVQFEVH